METHEHVLQHLNEEFKKVDKAFQSNELGVFGKDTDKLFKELDVIRRKQIDLASEHVSLESVHDMPLSKSNQDMASASDKQFEKKELMLKSMMAKLDDLTQTMERFKQISEA
ncbi:hypothetical protein BD560DRAFT_487887 [Blakeslea trispora]|nr:hypothetical protein BD560DRAFT_487887 [Blakeslea trispora]